MDIDIKTNMTLKDLCDYSKKQAIKVNHEYQRGLAWSNYQKQMFIDSLLRGYSAPAFYFHVKKTELPNGHINQDIEIIDGQQRVNAITAFFDNGFSLLDPQSEKGLRFPNFVKDKPCPWSGKRFSELTKDLQEQLHKEEIVVYMVNTENDAEVRDLFIRLQAGVPLTAQDKRDAWPGEFTEFVLTAGGKEGVDKWYGWDFFKLLKQQKSGNRRILVAQAYMLFSKVREEKRFCDIKSKNIDEFYHQNVDFDSDSQDAKHFEKICKKLHEEFIGHTPLVGHHILRLILFMDNLLQNYPNGWRGKLAQALRVFKERCDEANKANKNGNYEYEYYPYYSRYFQWTSSSSDTAPNIQRRHSFFIKEMVEILQLEPKDTNRAFTELEREAIFYRDERKCQYCKMDKELNDAPREDHIIEWQNAEIHHVVLHAEGGKTEISNGALMHCDCHPKKDAIVEVFRDWWGVKNHIALEKEGSPRKRQSKHGEMPPNGTEMFMKYNNKRYEAEVREGAIILKHDNTSHSSLSGAAVHITNNSVNGWKYWYLKLPGSEGWILADEWRKDNS